MAVYTPLTEADVHEALARYDIGALVSFEGVVEGVENTNYRVITTTGPHILTIFEKRVREEDLPFFIAVMDHLAQRGTPAPRPMQLRAGGQLTRIKDKPAVIVTFLDGRWPREPEPVHCAAVGAALAHMHNALADFPHQRANGLSLEGWEALIKPRLALADSLRPGLGADIENDMADVRAAWPQTLPRGVIHADLFPDNALFTGERLTGVIDFYFACTDFLAYDLAVCLNAWCFVEERAFSAERARALIGGYESVRPLSGAERDALPILARGAALRFFATRMADWSETPAGAAVTRKDPLEYADKLAFHRKVRSLRDYGV